MKLNYADGYSKKIQNNIIKNGFNKTYSLSRTGLYQSRFVKSDELDTFILNLESDFNSEKYYKNFLDYSYPESTLDINDRSLRENSINTIKLSNLSNIENDEILSILSRRKSNRSFTSKSWNMVNLEKLLFGVRSTNNQHSYSSAGGLYPVSLYLVFNNIKGLSSKKIFLYQPISNTLKAINQFEKFNITKYVDVGNFTKINNFNCFGVLVANRLINERKYGDRGFFFSLIEAGEILENLDLISTEYNYSFCQLGGFKRNKLEKILKIDDLYSVIVGTFIVGE